MATRTILGSLPGGGYGLRVSNPGFDADNANLTGRQLSFDSRYQKAPKIHMVITKAPSTTAQWIYFGKTFAAPPPYLFGKGNAYGTGYKMRAPGARADWRDTRNDLTDLNVHVGTYVDRIWLPLFDGLTSQQVIILDVE